MVIAGERHLGGDHRPIYNLATREDPSRGQIGVPRLEIPRRPVKFVLAGPPHAGVVNPPAKQKYNIGPAASPAENLDGWLAKAEEHPARVPDLAGLDQGEDAAEVGRARPARQARAHRGRAGQLRETGLSRSQAVVFAASRVI